MHELSIALSILDIAAEEAERRGGARIAAVHVKLGPLAGVVREALSSAFEMAREESSFPECRLVIRDVPLVIFCSRCGGERPAISIQEMCCSECGTPAADVVTGRELEVVAMEIL